MKIFHLFGHKWPLLAFGLFLLVATGCSVQLPQLTFRGHESIFEKEILGEYRLLEDEFFLLSPAPQSFPAAQGVRVPLLEVLVRWRNRQAQRVRLLQEGLVGEDSSGFLTLRLPPGSAVRTRRQLQRLLAEENRDRREILQALLAEAGPDSAAARRIRRRWVAFMQQKAPSGSWIQAENGLWRKK